MSNSNGDGPTLTQATADDPTTDSSGGRPCVELSKTASGKMVWKIRAYGDDTPEGLIAAKDVVVKINAELAERFPG